MSEREAAEGVGQFDVWLRERSERNHVAHVEIRGAAEGTARRDAVLLVLALNGIKPDPSKFPRIYLSYDDEKIAGKAALDLVVGLMCQANLDVRWHLDVPAAVDVAAAEGGPKLAGRGRRP